MKKFFITLLLTFGFIGVLQANDAWYYSLESGQIVPADNTKTNVQMHDEVIELTLNSDCYEVTVHFNFYNEGKGKSVRLYLLDSPAGLSREESTERYLTAPFESVFKVTPVHFEPKPYVAASREERHCSRCGESTREAFLKVIDGEVLCQDCAEKQ